MPSISKKLSAAKASPIVQMNNKVRALKEEGRDIINFSIGIPNFLPAEHIYEAAHKAVDTDKGIYLPPNGTDELIEAFQYRLKEDGFGDYAKNEICTAVGAKNALTNLFMILCDEGDEVIFPAPYWSSYIDTVELAGAVCKTISCGSDQHYKLTPEQLEAAITPKTKVFLFNNPSNPTGMVYTEAEIKALGDVLEKHDIWIISDDIYDKMIFDGDKFHHLLHTNPALRNRMCIVQSISKTYGMPGWRIGMIAAPEAVIKTHGKVAANTFMNVCGIAQAAAAAAFKGEHNFVAQRRDEFQEKRNMVYETLTSIDGIICPRPNGAFYAFPNVSGFFGKSFEGETIKDDAHLCELILEHASCACVPGSAFGDKNALRISYALPTEQLTKGLNNLKEFFNKCS